MAKVKVSLKPIEEYRTFKDATTNLSKSMRAHYATDLRRFCEFVSKTPDRIISERRLHLRSHDEHVKRAYERKVLEFHEYVKKSLGVRESTAFQMVVSLRGWFARNYAGLDFARRGPRRPRTERRDYIPTLGEVREIVDVSKVRNKALFLTELQTGLGPSDICELKRGWFEKVIKADEYPALITSVDRVKTRCPAQICIGSDAGRAIGRYLDLRVDSSPFLFVGGRRRNGEVQQLAPKFIDAAFQKAVVRAGVEVPNGLRLRVYALRKIFETQAGKVMPQPWVDLLMGHTIAGARAAYINPNDDELLEAYRKAEPLISITTTAPTLKSDEIEGLIARRVKERVHAELRAVFGDVADLVIKPKSGEERVYNFARIISALIAKETGKTTLDERDIIAILARAVKKSGMG